MYPKFVQREPHIGGVLCANAAEEQKLLEDWEAEKLKKAKAEAAEAKKAAEEAAEAQKLALKNAGK